MSDHFKFSPSGANRWRSCYASLQHLEQFPTSSNVYADAGRDHHAKIEELLKPFTGKHSYPIKQLQDELELLSKTVVSPYKECIEYLIGIVSNHKKGIEWELITEQKIQDKHNVELGGTIDLTLIVKTARINHLHTLDWKFGRTLVDIKDNNQLDIYTVLNLQRYELKFRRILSHIVQPLIGNYQTRAYTPLYLRTFEKRLREDIKKANTNPYFYNPSSANCGYCSFSNCHAYVGTTFKDIPVVPVNEKTLKDNVFSLDEKVKMIRAKKEIIKLLDSIETELKERLAQGEVIDTLKLEATLTNRFWTVSEQDILKEYLGDDFDISTLYTVPEPKLLSPAQVEKIVGVKKFRDVGLDALVSRVESGMKIVG